LTRKGGQQDVEHYEHLAWEVDGTVATVWLDREPVNAVHQPMYREIHALFSDVNQLGPDIRGVVLAGRNRHFCAGNDLDEFATMTGANARERMFHVREAFWAIYTCEVPVIAAVHGAALGTGLAIAASCDFVVAADDAKLGVPEITVGVMGAAMHLSRLVPQGIVRKMFYTGDPLPAAEIERFGGVLEVVPGDELLATARRHANRIARHSPVMIRTAKQSLTQIEFMNLKHGYEFEQSLTVAMADHPHKKEALAAVQERREAVYSVGDEG
jgi:enoyl-CoA hydratase